MKEIFKTKKFMLRQDFHFRAKMEQSLQGGGAIRDGVRYELGGNAPNFNDFVQ